jgi:hypothetical protein
VTVTKLAQYDGPFDPTRTLRDFSPAALAMLGREYLLHGHLQDRVGIPLVLADEGPEAMAQIAIDEWMAASPVYSRRTQRALGFGPGASSNPNATGDVTTIFKNIQLDVGSPHQFMDFVYTVHDPQHGEFQLAHCGALMDVEPMGEPFVRSMCHDIEDPTFDATAAATHPYAKVRPLHRPPRVPADQHPHCHWRVDIDPPAHDEPPFAVHENLALVAASRLASIELAEPRRDGAPTGLTDYSGTFDPTFQLEDLDPATLCMVLDEIAVQSHLLSRSYLVAVGKRYGDERALSYGRQQFTGSAGLTADRLARALHLGTGLDAMAKVFQMHPTFRPHEYIDARVALSGGTVRFAIGDCPAFHEVDDKSWIAELAPGVEGIGEEAHPALLAIARAIDPHAEGVGVAPEGDEVVAWEFTIDEAAAPHPEAPEVGLARFSTGATFVFVDGPTFRSGRPR